MAEGKKKAIEELKVQLLASQDELVRDGLKKLDSLGDNTFIPTLIEAYALREDDELKTKMYEILSSLKVSNIEDAFIDALENDRYKSIRKDLLAFMWNSGAQPVNNISLITRVAVEGDFEAALEAMTLIDSLEGPYDESDILDAMMEIKEFVNENKDDQKEALIVSIHDKLVEFEKLI